MLYEYDGYTLWATEPVDLGVDGSVDIFVPQLYLYLFAYIASVSPYLCRNDSNAKMHDVELRWSYIVALLGCSLGLHPPKVILFNSLHSLLPAKSHARRFLTEGKLR